MKEEEGEGEEEVNEEEQKIRRLLDRIRCVIRNFYEALTVFQKINTGILFLSCKFDIFS